MMRRLVYMMGNAKEILEACKNFLVICPTCDGSGEYNDEYGTQPCMLCNSRLIRVRSIEGEVDLDWGDTVFVSAEKLLVIEGNSND